MRNPPFYSPGRDGFTDQAMVHLAEDTERALEDFTSCPFWGEPL